MNVKRFAKCFGMALSLLAAGGPAKADDLMESSRVAGQTFMVTVLQSDLDFVEFCHQVMGAVADQTVETEILIYDTLSRDGKALYHTTCLTNIMRHVPLPG